MTGPPGASYGARRCWRLSKSDDVVTAEAFAPTGNLSLSSCPRTNAAAVSVFGGPVSLTGFTAVVPAHLRAGCDLPRLPNMALMAALDGLVVVGSGLWLTDKSIATVGNVSSLLQSAGALPYGTQVVQHCFVGLAGADLGNLTIKAVVSAPPGAPAPTLCLLARLDVARGLATVQSPLPGIALGADSCPTAFSPTSAQTYSVAFKETSAAVQAVVDGALKAKGLVLLNITGQRLHTRPIVSTTITLAGTLPAALVSDPAAAADPCNAFLLRSGVAAGTGSSVVDVKLGSVVVSTGGSSVTFLLADDSPANLVAGACTPPAARLLRAAGVHSPAGRMLLAAGVTVGVQIVTTFANQAALVTAVYNSSAATMAAAFTTAVIPGAAATAAAPTTGTASVVAAPAPFARAGVYVPSGDIIQFHAIPRFNVMGGEKPTNAFSFSASYAAGALAPAGGIIALGVVFAVVFAGTYLCAYCACCRDRNPRLFPKRDPRATIKMAWHTSRALLVFAVVNAGLLLAGIGYTARFSQSVDSAIASASELSVLLANTAKLMKSGNGGAELASYRDLTGTLVSGKTSLYRAAVSANSSIAALQEQMSTPARGANRLGGAQYDPPSGVVTLLATLSTNLGSAAATALVVSSTLGNVGVQLMDALHALPIEEFKTQATIAAFVLLTFLTGSLLIWASFVFRARFAYRVYKTFSPFVILFTMLVTILAGASYAIGVVGADVCVDPSQVILRVLPGFSPELTYYLNCATDPVVKAGGSLAEVQTAVDQIGVAWEQVSNLAVQVNVDRASASPSPPLMTLWNVAPGDRTNATFLDTAAASMLAALVAVTAVAETQVSCAAIDPILQRLYTSLCTEGFGSVIALARILIAASVLLVITLAIGLDVCCYHPGHEEGWAVLVTPKDGDMAVRTPVEAEAVGSAASPAESNAAAEGGNVHEPEAGLAKD